MAESRGVKVYISFSVNKISNCRGVHTGPGLNGVDQGFANYKAKRVQI